MAATLIGVDAARDRTRLKWELAIVLALSLGASGVYAIVGIIERMTRDVVLAEQTATINRSLAERPVFDLTYQLLGFFFALAPVALVMFLTWQPERPQFAGLGLGTAPGTRKRWLPETGWGVVLAAAIGIPGLAFYIFSRAVGINVDVVATALDQHWWTVPILILRALQAALTEELIVVAYLFNRLQKLGVSPWATIVTSALVRGSYHLYQGFGGFIGNVVMGLVFGWVYRRWGRSLPLVVAHWVLDIVSFVGYPLAVALLPQFFGSSV